MGNLSSRVHQSDQCLGRIGLDVKYAQSGKLLVVLRRIFQKANLFRKCCKLVKNMHKKLHGPPQKTKKSYSPPPNFTRPPRHVNNERSLIKG